MIYANGEKYDGQWENDQIHGQGIFTSIDKNEIQGQFENGTIKGESKITFKDGSTYIGGCANNMMNGSGKLTSADGKLIHQGNFKDNQRHGMGLQTEVDKSKRMGLWKQDQLETTLKFEDIQLAKKYGIKTEL